MSPKRGRSVVELAQAPDLVVELGHAAIVEIEVIWSRSNFAQFAALAAEIPNGLVSWPWRTWTR